MARPPRLRPLVTGTPVVATAEPAVSVRVWDADSDTTIHLTLAGPAAGRLIDHLPRIVRDAIAELAD